MKQKQMLRIINTCAFIHDAKEESIANILEMARYKEEGQLKVLLITGCLAQRYKEEIVNEFRKWMPCLARLALTTY